MGNRVKTVFLMAGLAAVVMLLGQAVGGAAGLTAAFFFALAMNAFMYWFSADMVLKQTRARVVTPAEAPDLHQLVAHLAGRAGLPMPRVAVVDDPSPNAFATGRDPAHAVVAATTGLLNLMSREELAGVLSHELAHVKHRDILVGSVAAVMASVIMFLASMAKYASLFGRGRSRGRGMGGAAAGLLTAILAPLAACLIQAAISRSREYMADDGGADIAGSSLGLASALEKLQAVQNSCPPLRTATPETASLFIVNPLSPGALRGLFATHPPLQERIDKLRGLTI
jgi:heat shock protein HtpX